MVAVCGYVCVCCGGCGSYSSVGWWGATLACVTSGAATPASGAGVAFAASFAARIASAASFSASNTFCGVCVLRVCVCVCVCVCVWWWLWW